jgi:hypothetical protein
MRRPRACLAKHAPGRRRDSAWRPIRAARQELADGGRPVFHGRPRKARPGAARKTPQMSPDCASLSGWRAERRPVFPRGNAGTSRTMVAPLGAPSPSYFEGRQTGRRAYPGPRQTIRVMTLVCIEDLAARLGCLTSKSLRQPPVIPANAGIQGWMPACAGMSGCCEAAPQPRRHARACRGHPRLSATEQDVGGRDFRREDGASMPFARPRRMRVCASFTSPAMAGEKPFEN